jgi:hypothetical protein
MLCPCDVKERKGKRSRPAYILVQKKNSYYNYLVTFILKTKCCLFVKDLLILLHLFTGVNINVQYIHMCLAVLMIFQILKHSGSN